jgi:thiosulfate dehydrogenase (quinone) large subunit
MESPALLDRKLAYLLLRLTLGMSLFIRGVGRLAHLGAFADGLVKLFAQTWLPAFLVRPFALGLMFVETIVGLLLIFGLWTRFALLLGALSMIALVFGTALLADWNTQAIQMLYALIYAALIATREYNSYSVDARIQH